MAETTNLGSLGEAKVQIRVDWEKLDGDLEKTKGKIGSAFEKSSTLMRNVGAAMTAGLTVPLTALVTKSTLAASRVNELESVNLLLGKSAGYSKAFIQEQAAAVQDMGIEAAASQEIIADFIKADLDLADASHVARVAQDAAVIAGKNSTETTKTLTQAIIMGRSELFKSAGMIVDMNSAYRDYAELTGDASRELTEQEKIQARVNMTMAYGERIAGAYMTAMEDPGKVLRSYPRYLNDIAVAFGQNFIPAFKEAIFAGKDLLEWLKDAVSEGGALDPVIERWGERFSDAARFVGNLVEGLDEMDPALLQTVADFLAFGAAMGPVLLIGGQVTKWAGSAVNSFVGLAGAFGMSKAAALGALGPIGAGITVAAGALALYKHQIDENVRVSKVHSQELVLGSNSYREYVESVQAANAAHQVQRGTIISTNDALGAGFSQLTAFSKQTDLLTESEWRRVRAAQKVAEIQDQMNASVVGTNFEQAYLAAMADMGADAGYYADQAARAGLSTREWLVEMGYLVDMKDDISNITSLDAYFDEMVGLAKQYDSILGEIGDKQGRINELTEIMETGGYIDGLWKSAKDANEEIEKLTGEIGTLEERMTQMANQVVLDMFMATIAVDGVFQEEADAYFKMAADMGIISEEAAQAAILAYGNAIDTINGMGIDDKTSNVRVNVSYNDPLGFVTGGRTTVHAAAKFDNPTMRAAGGLVYGGEPVLVGERGPELYLPKVSGSIIANSELERSLRGGGDTNISQTQQFFQGGTDGETLMLVVDAVNRLPRAIKVALREAMATMGS